MSRPIFVILPSNTKTSPPNRTNKFRVRLPQNLRFDGDWFCGVHSIVYPHSWSLHDEFLIELILVDGRVIQVRPKFSKTRHLESFTNELNNSIKEKVLEYFNDVKINKQIIKRAVRQEYDAKLKKLFDTGAIYRLTNQVLAIVTAEDIYLLKSVNTKQDDPEFDDLNPRITIGNNIWEQSYILNIESMRELDKKTALEKIGTAKEEVLEIVNQSKIYEFYNERFYLVIPKDGHENHIVINALLINDKRAAWPVERKTLEAITQLPEVQEPRTSIGMPIEYPKEIDVPVKYVEEEIKKVEEQKKDEKVIEEKEVSTEPPPKKQKLEATPESLTMDRPKYFDAEISREEFLNLLKKHHFKIVGENKIEATKELVETFIIIYGLSQETFDKYLKKFEIFHKKEFNKTMNRKEFLRELLSNGFRINYDGSVVCETEKVKEEFMNKFSITPKTFDDMISKLGITCSLETNELSKEHTVELLRKMGYKISEDNTLVEEPSEKRVHEFAGIHRSQLREALKKYGITISKDFRQYFEEPMHRTFINILPDEYAYKHNVPIKQPKTFKSFEEKQLYATGKNEKEPSDIPVEQIPKEKPKLGARDIPIEQIPKKEPLVPSDIPIEQIPKEKPKLVPSDIPIEQIPKKEPLGPSDIPIEQIPKENEITPADIPIEQIPKNENDDIIQVWVEIIKPLEEMTREDILDLIRDRLPLYRKMSDEVFTATFAKKNREQIISMLVRNGYAKEKDMDPVSEKRLIGILRDWGHHIPAAEPKHVPDIASFYTPKFKSNFTVNEENISAISETRFIYDYDLNRYYIDFPSYLVSHILLSERMAYMMGYEKDHTIQYNEFAKYIPDLKADIHQLYLYENSGLTENIIVGDSLTSLLRIVNVESHFGDTKEIIYTTPIFKKVIAKEINEIELEIKTSDNRYVPFNYGNVIVTLLFENMSHRLF